MKYIWMIIAMMGFFSCSYEDKSGILGESLPDIIIDTSGITQNGDPRMFVKRDSLLTISPKIEYEGGSEDDFEYEWRLGLDLDGGSYPLMENYIVLSTEKDLKWKVDIYETPSYKYYPLWFRVKHKETKVIAYIRWSLAVSADVLKGLAVVDTDDDRTCDISVIADSVFDLKGKCVYYNDGVPGARVYHRNIYSANMGHKFDGVIKKIFHQKLYRGASLTHYLHGFSDNNRLFRMEVPSFDIVAEGKDLFYDPDIELKIDNYRVFGNRSVLVNDGKVHTRENEKLGEVSIRKFGNYQLSNIRIPGEVCGYTDLAFYSEEDGKFYYTYFEDFYDDGAWNTFSTVNGGTFDPNDLQGYKNVIATEYFSSEYRFILEKGGRYYFCTIDRYGQSPGLFYDLSAVAPNISQAVDIAIDVYNKLIFYATKEKLYVINYTSDLMCREFELDPEDPINRIFTFNEFHSTDSQMGNLNSNIMFSTYNGTEGKLYVVRVDKTGNIVKDPGWTNGVHVFDGFKKIVCVSNVY